MKIKYFSDTDTLLINFTDKEIVETRDLNENILIELDKDGNLVSMTIEHARRQADIEDFHTSRFQDNSSRQAALSLYSTYFKISNFQMKI